MSNSTGETHYPLYPQAVVLPILALPSWILCLAPMFWLFSQRNIAAASLILYMTLLNFFNFTNALIWPRDNIHEWWNGEGFCDIQAYIQAAVSVSLALSAAVLARRLANVMDTRNIRLIPSKRSIMIERCIEIGFCWVIPALFMIIYYTVQPFRYFIYGIAGCTMVYDSSWMSFGLMWIWGPIAALGAAYYSGLLVFRLCRYRREFHSLVAARNTTKSRFMRLFIMALVVSVVLMPYSFFIAYDMVRTINKKYSWDRVHGPDWNHIEKKAAAGTPRYDRWGEIATGYMIFLCFGTGSDANNIYKNMLVCLGFGKLFPSLYVTRDSVASPTQSNVTFGKQWTSGWSNKAKSLFSRTESVSELSHKASFTASTAPPMSANSMVDPMLPPRSQVGTWRHNVASFFGRLFHRRAAQHSILPLHDTTSVDADGLFALDKTPSNPTAFTAHAWAADNASISKDHDESGVYVQHEVHQATSEKHQDKMSEKDEWVV